MTWTPETPISQDQEPPKPTKPRRGCTFFLGIVFVIFVAAAMLFLTFGAFFVGPQMPTFGEALGVVRLDYPIYDGTEAVQEIEVSLVLQTELVGSRLFLVAVDGPVTHDDVARIEREHGREGFVRGHEIAGGLTVRALLDQLSRPEDHNPREVLGLLVFEVIQPQEHGDCGYPGEDECNE